MKEVSWAHIGFWTLSSRSTHLFLFALFDRLECCRLSGICFQRLFLLETLRGFLVFDGRQIFGTHALKIPRIVIGRNSNPRRDEKRTGRTLFLNARAISGGLTNESAVLKVKLYL